MKKNVHFCNVSGQAKRAWKTAVEFLTPRSRAGKRKPRSSSCLPHSARFTKQGNRGLHRTCPYLHVEVISKSCTCNIPTTHPPNESFGVSSPMACTAAPRLLAPAIGAEHPQARVCLDGSCSHAARSESCCSRSSFPTSSNAPNDTTMRAGRSLPALPDIDGTESFDALVRKLSV